MNRAYFRGFLFLLTIAFVWSTPVRSQVFVNSFETTEQNKVWLNDNSQYDSEAYDGEFIHRTTPEMEFGCGLEVPFPDSLSGKNMLIRVEAAFRFHQLPKSAIYVITLQRGDSLLYWHGLPLKDSVKTTGIWSKASTVFKIPSDIITNSKIKMYLWNPGKELIDTDLLTLRLETVTMPTYIPQITKNESVGNEEILFRNEYFQLLFYKESGSVLLGDADGKAITLPISMFTSIIKNGRTKIFQTSAWTLKSIGVEVGKHKILLISKNSVSTVELNLIASDGQSELQCRLVSTFNKNVKLSQHSLAIRFTDPVSKVYRKNALLDDVLIQDEYYIDKQGVTFGESERQVTVYHLNEISSGQVSANNGLLVLNLDYAADHPQLYFPLLNRKTNVYEDISANEYNKGQGIVSSFNISIGSKLIDLPRLMPVPSGYEAAIIWTEHADWTDIRTQRAVNFGREDIVNISEAVGGFARYEIPVTKSVFYHNPDSINNTSISKNLFNGLHESIKSDSVFFGFLEQLHGKGFEICLHTPEQFTSNRQYLDEALGFMQTAFGSPTWIDHGYNNKSVNNRENAVCDGFNAKSPLFAADLWKKYGVRYFWNPYYEDVRPYDSWNFYGNLIFPYPGFGDRFPDRMISSNPVRYDGLLWSTASALAVNEPSLWNYYLDKTRLQMLLTYHSVYINHVYPAWVNDKVGCWTRDADGKIVAQEQFNQALSRIHEMHLAGRLLPTTIAAQLRYHELVQHISYSVQNDGSIVVENNNRETIKGLSFITRANSVLVNGATPENRKVNEELIFWFDLEVGERVKIASFD
ncbi:MAG: hypothetical protein HOO86_00190 [Bacteroidales bacterium]|nr:hypothetical protein [Bacteroidales bacterium]